MAIALLLLGLVLFVSLPQQLEKSASACDAAGARLVRTRNILLPTGNGFAARLSRGLTRGFAGPVVEEAIRARYPNVPVALACPAVYWAAPFLSNQQILRLVSVRL